jgi:E3 ubiquitin-protein ligase UBR3
MYNLLYYQAVLQLCTKLTDLECEEIVEKYAGAKPVANAGVGSLGAAMAFMLENLDKCKRFRKDLLDYDEEMMEDSNEFGESSKSADAKEQKPSTSGVQKSGVDIKALENELQSLCLPFLRIAALLRHHIYHQELPEVKTADFEFPRLIYFLELVTKSMDRDKFNGAKGLCFVPGTEFSLPKRWCEELMDLSPPFDTTRELIMNNHVAWQQPKLLGLPREYERLFTVSFLLILNFLDHY